MTSVSRKFSNEGGAVPEMIVRLVPPGGAYGREGSLINEGDEPLIEFYDPRFPHDDLEGDLRGQFVSRYRLTDLSDGADGGIALDGGVPDWSLTEAGFANAMAAISVEACREVSASLLRDAGSDAISDIVSDLLREMADEADIPEGDDRDAYLADKLEGFDFSPEAAADIIAASGTRADRIGPFIRSYLPQPSPEPGA